MYPLAALGSYPIILSTLFRHGTINELEVAN